METIRRDGAMNFATGDAQNDLTTTRFWPNPIFYSAVTKVSSDFYIFLIGFSKNLHDLYVNLYGFLHIAHDAV